MRNCLNCGAELNGSFCAACGQRVVPADPTVSELAGDVFEELSGYDGRIASTFRNLLHPGRLTIDYLQGRRVRYLSPVRLYLTVSVIYFLIAASTPVNVITQTKTRNVSAGEGININLTDPAVNNGVPLTAEDRAELVKQIQTAPWFIRGMLTAIATDPQGFRGRLFTIMPRVFFAMLPVFAGILALFYRGRRFPTALVFAAHLHAFAFLGATLAELAKMTRSQVVQGTVSGIVILVFAWYALASLRAVFGGRWPITIAKALGIGFTYSAASIPFFFVILIWASLV